MVPSPPTPLAPHRSILDPTLGPVIGDCAAIAASFSPAPVYLGLLERRFADDEPSLQHKAAVLEVTAHMIRCGGSEDEIPKRPNRPTAQPPDRFQGRLHEGAGGRRRSRADRDAIG